MQDTSDKTPGGKTPPGKTTAGTTPEGKTPAGKTPRTRATQTRVTPTMVVSTTVTPTTVTPTKVFILIDVQGALTGSPETFWWVHTNADTYSLGLKPSHGQSTMPHGQPQP